MALVLKITFNNDVRRISTDKEPTFPELNSLVAQLFPVLPKHQLKYVDEDGDYITMTSDLELKEAITLASRHPAKTLRLSIHLVDVPSTPPSSSSPFVAREPTQPSSQPQQQQQQQSIPPFNPFGLLNNPELLQNLLPQLPVLLQTLGAAFPQASSGGGSTTTGGANVPLVDLSALFQNLGLGNNTVPSSSSQTSASQQQQQQQSALGLQQLLAQLMASPMAQSFLPQISAVVANLAQQQAASTSGSTSSSPPAHGDAPTSSVHEGVQCDGCEKQDFSGLRYKCSVCPNYDLCEQCEMKRPHVHDSSHPMLKMNQPMNHHRGHHSSFGRGCPYSYRAPWWNGRGAHGGFRPHWASNNFGCGGNTAASASAENNNSNSNSNSNSGPSSKCGGSSQSRLLARFVADVSISDGTFMEPEQSFVKIWKMRNEGTKAWEEGTRLAFVGGDKLSAIEYVSVPAVNAGDEIDISVDMVSPSRAGRYIGYWRLSSPDGTRFGQRVWVDVVVSPSASTSASAPAAASPSSLPTVVQSNSVAPVPAKDVMEVESQPKVAPVVIATPAEEEPVSTEVQQLMDMGFTNKALNRQLLEANRNDIFKVVQILLNNLN